MTKRHLFALAAAGTVTLGFSVWRPWTHRSRADISEALKRAGYKPDSSGRFLFSDRSLGGITPAYDPNRRDPTIGFRACSNRIDACIAHKSNIDECVTSAPRCVSATPWKNDPGGDDCCPDSCVREYLNSRKTETPIMAITDLVHSMCYPGLESFLNGSAGATP